MTDPADRLDAARLADRVRNARVQNATWITQQALAQARAAGREEERRRIRNWAVAEGIHSADSWFVAQLDAPAEEES